VREEFKQKEEEMAATSSEREALAPFVGEWMILAAFENMPPADIGAGSASSGWWESAS
jgi:hypothetical protein